MAPISRTGLASSGSRLRDWKLVDAIAFIKQRAWEVNHVSFSASLSPPLSLAHGIWFKSNDHIDIKMEALALPDAWHLILYPLFRLVRRVKNKLHRANHPSQFCASSTDTMVQQPPSGGSRKISFNVSEQYEIQDVIGEGAYGVVW